MSRLTALAFELARTGKFQTIEHIKQKLKREGLDDNQIAGPVLMRQLREAIADAHLVPPQSKVSSIVVETPDRK